MSFSLEELKKIPITIQYEVFGFMRNCENETNLNIPNLITYICLSFYYINEHFMITHEQIKLSDDKVEEGKIFDFIDMKCGRGWEIKGFDNREVILQTKKLSK